MEKVSRPSAEHEKLFAALNPSLRVLANRGALRNYRKNTVVITEGEQGDSLFVLLAGEVKVFATDEHGRELTYGTIAAGDYFGEMSLDGGPRSASVMTTQPSVCSVVNRAAVRDHIADEPEFALELVAQVIRRARSATETARQMALLDVYGRVIHMLENQHGPARHGEPIELTQSIASRVGASREMVSRLLKDLEKGGYIELGVKRITLKKKLPARW
jgi:CRP/FNR family transcriptional regulator, cyclic AMP receptor protein